ncbi:hypothetical protein DFA_07213 [Cavenderia fasciculata]|uniref:ComC supersandwich domain-containing protein n=1 Tax=Cavenderia fasciculata TaxID=261658 RepID=F4PVT2_CACFS|nr:uncharacterized protein DFA_07213 [Cavenderia fasciculata]EGG20096.1 hypothetical protein DFA_07213 [Cavenderia fasciculata]|eukprot:XP_004367079.1 hypothetical protein DFA_07213 [Cavenderia fasciculata]
MNTTRRSYNQIVLIVISILLLWSSNIGTFVDSQSLPADELASVVFMINQYGLQSFLPLNDTACNSAVQGQTVFSCSIVAGQMRVLQVNILSPPPSGFPSNVVPVTSLSFPELLTLKIHNAPTQNPNIQILDLIGNCLKLQILEIVGDASLTQIKSNFPGPSFTKLESLVISENPNLESIVNFFNGSVIKFLSLFGNPKLSFQINDTMVLDKLLNFGVDFMLDDTIFTMTKKSFPTLEVFGATSHANNVAVEIDCPIIGISSDMRGPKTALLPNDIGLFTNLVTFSLQSTPFSSFQIPSTLSSTLVSMIIKDAKITGVSNKIRFPVNITTVDLTSNLLKAMPPAVVFEQVASTNIILSMNQILTPVTSDFCRHTIDIRNTNIQSVADCFWCYPQSILTDLPYPQNFQCTPALNTTGVVPSIGGYATLTGSKLGWGVAPSRVLVVNSVILYPFTEVSPIQNRMVSLGTNITIPVSLIVADITVRNIVPIIHSTNNTITLRFTQQVNPYVEHRVIISNDQRGVSLVCNLLGATCSTEGLNGGDYNFTMSNEFNSFSTVFTLQSPNSYPLVTSTQLNGLKITLSGYFGPSVSQNHYVKLNNTAICTITNRNVSYIECNLLATPPPGVSSVQVSVDGYSISLNNVISIPFPPSQSLKQQCIDQTSNCYGHGQCNDQGVCQCDQGYYDNCRFFKNPNVTFVQNDTKPVATFELDGYQFFFSLVAIQELDGDDIVVQELITDQWNVTDQSGDNLTSLHYRLLINSTLYPTLSPIVNVTSLIEYSTLDRQLPFGDSIVSVGANSIKVGVNVTGWQYQSILSHLRVVFSTIVNNEQSIQSCSNSDIPTFEQILGSDSYLRVIKNDTQFYGRFLSYSYSDGRKTFSRNELINQTRIVGSDTDSLALIGVHVPQCTFCLLDPDFSALVVGQDKEQDCSSESSNTWKIAVGVAVGGAVLIALVVGAVLYLRDSNFIRFKFGNLNRSIKLKTQQS